VSLASGNLVRALQNGFAGVENETAIALREHTKHDWTITQTTCDIYFDHSNMDRTTVPPEVVTKKVARAIGCLRRKVVRLPDI
jgi:hypothetical protein